MTLPVEKDTDAPPQACIRSVHTKLRQAGNGSSPDSCVLQHYSVVYESDILGRLGRFGTFHS